MNNAEPLLTCALLMTEPNELAAELHDRMPVIVHPEDRQAWLEGKEIPLIPYPAIGMTERLANTYVNTPGYEGPKCLEPPEPSAPKKGHQQRELFGREDDDE